jgi:hypothetical protein
MADTSTADVKFTVGTLTRQGVFAKGCSIFTCGPSTGHFVTPIAFCASPEMAAAIAQFVEQGRPDALSPTTSGDAKP